MEGREDEVSNLPERLGLLNLYTGVSDLKEGMGTGDAVYRLAPSRYRDQTKEMVETVKDRRARKYQEREDGLRASRKNGANLNKWSALCEGRE